MILRFLKSGYQKVKDILTKAGSLLGKKLRQIFQKPIDEEMLENLERLFYEADFGVQTATSLTETVRSLHRKKPTISSDECLQAIREEILRILTSQPAGIQKAGPGEGPTVFMIVGVNGNGKTTTIAKLTRRFQQEGDTILWGAADTFRAAAKDQLQTWAERLGVDVVHGNANSDPAAVAFDTVSAGKARGCDLVMIDTAGRLHTKTHLMQELDKIRRAIRKVAPQAPHETLLVLDATTGQNAIDQAKIFHQYLHLTGLIVTKLDGTAKGGIIVHIYRELGIPVKFIGLGEGVDDLEPFDPEKFVQTLFE